MLIEYGQWASMVIVRKPGSFGGFKSNQRHMIIFSLFSYF
jgi:hypothetical protein